MSECFRIDDHVLHLDPALGLRAQTATDAFWRDRDAPVLTSGRLLSVFSYDATWGYQERHPDGDELVLVLDGDVDLLLDAGEGERAVRLGTGEACVVPASTWHRAAVRTRATMLFVTPVPARTEHRTMPG